MVLDLKCDILPISSAKKSQKKLEQVNRTVKYDNIKKMSLKLSELMSLSLKNYSYKFKDEDVDETSTYVEIFGCTNRMIVKKTSLICKLVNSAVIDFRESKKQNSPTLEVISIVLV